MSGIPDSSGPVTRKAVTHELWGDYPETRSWRCVVCGGWAPIVLRGPGRPDLRYCDDHLRAGQGEENGV